MTRRVGVTWIVTFNDTRGTVNMKRDIGDTFIYVFTYLLH